MDELIDRVRRRTGGWRGLKEVVVGGAGGVHIVVHVQVKSAKGGGWRMK